LYTKQVHDGHIVLSNSKNPKRRDKGRAAKCLKRINVIGNDAIVLIENVTRSRTVVIIIDLVVERSSGVGADVDDGMKQQHVSFLFYFFTSLTAIYVLSGTK